MDFIDESEVLTPADEENHIWKHDFKVPFVCGARNLGEALRRIAEGAAMIRTKGEAGSGNIVEAVRHMRTITSEMRRLTTLRGDEFMRVAKELGTPLDLVREVANTGKLPVPNFSAGGIATPADAALVRHLGAEAVFVGSGIFKSSDPEKRAKAIVKATTHFQDPKAVLEASEELGEAMKGLDIRQIDEKICCKRAAGKFSSDGFRSAGILPADFGACDLPNRWRDAGATKTTATIKFSREIIPMELAIKVGILAVQGDFEAHAATLARMGVEYVFVRTPRDLEGVDAVILPGGESTTQWKFLVEEGLDKSLTAFAEKGGAIFGTCAGAILLAREVRNPVQESLGLADITVIRNAYGRQLASEVRHGATAISPEPIEMVFIRAPIIERVGPDIEVLAKSEGQPVLIRQGRILIATFHPELSKDNTVHEYFIGMAKKAMAASGKTANDLVRSFGNNTA